MTLPLLEDHTAGGRQEVGRIFRTAVWSGKIDEIVDYVAKRRHPGCARCRVVPLATRSSGESPVLPAPAR